MDKLKEKVKNPLFKAIFLWLSQILAIKETRPLYTLPPMLSTFLSNERFWALR